MDAEGASGAIGSDQGVGWQMGLAGLDNRALLEGLTRVLAREPKRLHHVASVVDRLRSSEQGQDILPDGFDALWRVFEEVLPPAEDDA